MEVGLTDISLYDLMAADWDIWLGRNNQGYTISLRSDCHDDREVKACGVHPFAVESFATLCRQFLRDYASIERRELAA
jgi:hypothetical protein